MALLRAFFYFELRCGSMRTSVRIYGADLWIACERVRRMEKGGC